MVVKIMGGEGWLIVLTVLPVKIMRGQRGWRWLVVKIRGRLLLTMVLQVKMNRAEKWSVEVDGKDDIKR